MHLLLPLSFLLCHLSGGPKTDELCPRLWSSVALYQQMTSTFIAEFALDVYLLDGPTHPHVAAKPILARSVAAVLAASAVAKLHAFGNEQPLAPSRICFLLSSYFYCFLLFLPRRPSSHLFFVSRSFDLTRLQASFNPCRRWFCVPPHTLWPTCIRINPWPPHR